MKRDPSRDVGVQREQQEMLAAKPGLSPRNKIPQAKRIPEEVLAAVRMALRYELAALHGTSGLGTTAVRDAVRTELDEAVARGGLWRDAMRTELEAALRDQDGLWREAMRTELEAVLRDQGAAAQRWSASPAKANTARCSSPTRAFAEEFGHDSEAGEDSMPTDVHAGSVTSVVGKRGTMSVQAANIEDRHREAVGLHFSRFISQGSVDPYASESHLANWLYISQNTKAMRYLDSWYLWFVNVEEPKRTGRLAEFVMGKLFEFVVCSVIFLNIAFMVYSANHAIENPRNPSDLTIMGDVFFQIFYTLELVLKVLVHRHFFFFNTSWRLNWFDLFLVVSGYVTLFADSSGVVTGTFLRVLRLVKFGKAMRAVRIMAQLKHLRNFLVCLQGSFENFLWSCVMLCMVFLIYALFLMQQVSAHLEENGLEVDGGLEAMFGTVGQSILTLYQSALGGDDWKIAYDVINETGTFASFIFLTYIAFVQLALINIITGIFVESAMLTLTPDRETVALEHELREKEYARDLERLCKNVDDDRSGKLTPEQFQEGMRKGRIPTLLTLLGLSRHHVMEFFNTLSALAVDDGGQVDIHHFVAGCMKLKGPATNFDLQTLHSQFNVFEKSLEIEVSSISKRLHQIETGAPPTRRQSAQ